MKKELTREEQLLKERFNQLYNYGKSNVVTEDVKINLSELLEYKKAGDGRIYGIVKENQDYFIKTATEFNGKTPSVEDFVYINGLHNKNDFRYNKLNETQKILSTKIKAINEAYGFVDEDVIPLDDENENVAPPKPEGQEAPAEAPVEQSPEGQEAPVEQSPEENDEDSDPVNKAKSHIGKAGNYIKNSPEISSEMAKQMINMLIGYIDVINMSQDDKQDIINKLNNEEIEEEVDIQMVDDEIDMELDEIKKTDKKQINEEIMPDAETISYIINGVGAIFGGAYGIDKLMSYLKKKNPKAAETLEKLGKASGDSIAKGSEKYKVESENKSSKDLIKEYSEKYGVTEDSVLKVINKQLNEQKDAILKEEKERKLRLTIRNILKEKLGIKKKVLKEGKENPTRKKLEEAVDKYLDGLNKKK